jgi:hypothetical protein
MLKHIVMFRLSTENSVINKQILKDKLDQLKNKIPEIRSIETGLNISTRPSAYDLVLITEFDTEQDLEAYRIHPDHQDIVRLIKENAIETHVVDFDF